MFFVCVFENWRFENEDIETEGFSFRDMEVREFVIENNRGFC